MAPAPQLLPQPPASFQPGFQRPVQASWAQPGGAPQHPPGAYGQPWGPPPAFGPPGSQAAQVGFTICSRRFQIGDKFLAQVIA